MDSQVMKFQVKGCRLTSAGYHDGDVIRIHKSMPVSDGDMVLASVGKIRAIYQYRRDSEGHQLVPFDPQWGVIGLPESGFEKYIEGVVVS